MKQTNIEKLISWMEEKMKSNVFSNPTSEMIYIKAKEVQLQQEEPSELEYLRAEFEANKEKVYTQEELDRFIEVSFLRGQQNANYK